MRRCLGLIAVAVLLLGWRGSATFAQPDKSPPLLKKVTFKKPELDEYALGQILKIDAMTGSYELNAKPSTIDFGVEFYQAGKKLDVKPIRGGIEAPEAVLPTAGEFTLQMVDLDHIVLANAKPKHWRMNVYLRLSGASKTSLAGVTPVDVPKTAFRSVVARGSFSTAAGNRKKAPMFWLASRASEGSAPLVQSSASVQELVEKNKDHSFIVGSLYFTGAKP